MYNLIQLYIKIQEKILPAWPWPLLRGADAMRAVCNSQFFFLSELSKSIEFLIKFNFKYLRNLMNFKSLKQAHKLIKLVGHVAWAR